MAADESAAVRDGASRRLSHGGSRLHQEHSTNRRVLMYKNASFLTNTCGNPTPVSCQTRGQLRRGARARPGEPARPLDPARLVRQPDLRPQLHERVTTPTSARPPTARRRSTTCWAASEGHAGWNGVFFDESDARLLQQHRQADLRRRRLAHLPDQLELADGDEGLLDVVGAGIRGQGFYVAGNAASSATRRLAHGQAGGRASPPTSTASCRSSSR